MSCTISACLHTRLSVQTLVELCMDRLTGCAYVYIITPTVKGPALHVWAQHQWGQACKLQAQVQSPSGQ